MLRPWAIFKKPLHMNTIGSSSSDNVAHVVTEFPQRPCVLVTNLSRTGPAVTWSQTADIFFLEIVTASSHVEGSCWRRRRRQIPADPHHILRKKGIIRSAVIAVLMVLYVVSMSTVYKVLTCVLQCSFYFSKKIQNMCSLFNLLTWGVHLLLSECFTSVSEWSCYIKLNHWKAFS